MTACGPLRAGRSVRPRSPDLERTRWRLAAGAALLTAVVACSDTPPPSLDSLRLEAESLASDGDRRSAIAAFQRLLRLAHEDASTRWHLARLYRDLGELDLAESYLEGARAHGLSPSSVLPMLAEVLLAKQDYKELFALQVPSEATPAAGASVFARQAIGRVEVRDVKAAQSALALARSLDRESVEVALADATISLAQGRSLAAREALQAAVASHPESAEALGMLGDVLRAAGRLEEAEVVFGRALAHSPFKAHFHFVRGEVRLDLGEVAAADADIAVLEEAAAGTFPASYLRGRRALMGGDTTAAMSFLNTAVELQPRHVPALLYGGVAAYAVGQTQLAEERLLRVIKEAPGNAPARLIMGAIRFDQARYADAETFLRTLPPRMPGAIFPKRLLAASLVAQNKAAEAVPLLSELVVAEPSDPRSQLDLAVALVLSGAEQRGLQGLDGLVARHPDYRPTYRYLVAYHLRAQSWDQAARWADRYHEQYPEDAQPLVFKGDVLIEAGRQEEARQVFQQVLDDAPAHPEANLRMAAMALADGDGARAASHFDNILARDPENLDALMGHARLALESNNPKAAAQVLERAVRLRPEALPPRLLLARIKLGSNEALQAAETLKYDAVPSFRQDGDYLTLLGEALLAAGTPQLAADAARELISLRPDSLSAYALYARILTVLDDKIALEDTLKQILTIDPQNVQARLELVRLHIATERLGVAERLLSPLLADLDRPALADLLYGLILTATDRAAQAVAPLQHAHAALSSQRTLLALANAEAQAGSLDSAIERQTAWLGERPDDVEVRVNLAGHLVQAERVSDALSAYERALQTSPDHLVALNNLAWYSLEADPERAVALAQRAHELRPESLETAHTLVNAQVEAGQWRDAELTLDRAMARDPTDPGLLWLSARVLHQKGRAEGALRRLERLLENEIPRDERRRAEVLLAQIQDELGIEDDDW